VNKLVLTLVIPFITLTVSCAGSARPDADCSGAGFYSLPESIIASWGDKRDLSSNRNYVLARAYRDSKEYKKAILYYCNSCFSSHRDFSLRLFPSPVYRFVDGFHFKSELYDDAVYQIALLFQQYREFEYSVRFTRLVSRKHPGLYRDARLLEAQCLVSLGKNSEALGILMDIYDRYPKQSSYPLR